MNDLFTFLISNILILFETDKNDVLENNSELKSKGDNLRSEFKNLKKDSSPEEKKELFSKKKEYNDELYSDIIKLDPNAEPIIDKIKSHNKMRKNIS